MQRALLQQRIADIGRLFLFQPFAFPKRQAVRPMRDPCRLQGAAGVAALAQREQIRFWIFSRLGVWPTQVSDEALQRMTKTPATVFRSL